MSLIERAGLHTRAFMIDYYDRHKHPVNAALHVIGVPMVFYGLWKLIGGRFAGGAGLITLGYVLQYFGHQAQGNEVGEVTLIKNIARRIREKKNTKEDAND